MTLGKKITSIALTTALIAALATLLLPMPATWHDSWWAFHIPLVEGILLLISAIGGAVLFVLSSRTYKAGLRRAYGVLALGIVLTALSNAQIPLMSAFDLWEAPWFSRGGVAIPYLSSGIVLYTGARMLARLVGAETWVKHLWAAIPFTIVGALLAILIPHAPLLDSTEAMYDAGNALGAWLALFYLSAALVILAVAKHVGAHYTNAMLWLFLTMMSIVLVVAVSMLYSSITGQTGGKGHGIALLVNSTTLLFTGFATLRAGYVFSKTTEIKKDTSLAVSSGMFFVASLFGYSHSPLASANTLLDMVIATASLASNPAAIETILDKVRILTAGLHPGQILNQQEENTLIGVYLEVEQHLMHRDPVRAFDQGVLRAQLSTDLQQQITKHESQGVAFST